MSSFEKNEPLSSDQSGERSIDNLIRDELKKAPVVISTPQQTVVVPGEMRSAGLTREGRTALGQAGTVPSSPLPSEVVTHPDYPHSGPGGTRPASGWRRDHGSGRRR